MKGIKITRILVNVAILGAVIVSLTSGFRVV